ncbi:type I methionyl aminopeptidase [Candidatus Kaiserbacteria bacterium RIFCSPHIGHO2_01_FULL_46_22]|uniref:Methionine aminopeptidase n=1 Tax=Candidatus Kaiserbacteria bacterium RIFCSPHIGHO2_01_FULL_46_22 TaxID=1798475 RepID=A0A1F6BWP6_9BACT|nr:MAG: type I methionyl aminopeptidase [Candidatus Kaiserbacteria bacterium RIFCSPHIGHO2_01_FULL_46_22]
MGITIKTEEDIQKLREGGRLLGMILDELEKEVTPGATSLDVDDRAAELLEEHELEPMILGYQPSFAPRPYPAVTCVSVNDVVVHGIPNEEPVTFKDGDVVSIDLVIGYQGMVLDSARTVIAGQGSEKAKELLSVTKNALYAAIKAVKPGVKVSAIGAAEEAVVPKGYGIVEDLCGHGVGYSLHEEPQVPNYVQKGNPGPVLRPGMVLAIEPMIVQGSKDVVFDTEDGYTVRSKDGGLTAHMEHTVLITESGSEILTPSQVAR